MKRIIVTGAALLAIVPASLGLLGNASFAQSVPVRVPSQASVLDDKGGLTPHVEPGDDKGGLTTQVQPGDDKGGLTTQVQPGGKTVRDSSSGKDNTVVTNSTKGAKDDGSGHS